MRHMLHEFVAANRDELIARTRAKVAGRSAPRPTQRELDSGVPLFLNQLVEALQHAGSRADAMHAIGESAILHGVGLLRQGFSISQVVHGYGDVCQAVTELAQETDASISTDEFHTLNRCLDDAIAQAVTGYSALREKEMADEENARSGMLAHELRNRLSAATMGFDLIKRGTVPVGGSVSALVARNLARMSSLIHRSMVEVRLSAGTQYRERVAVAALIEEAEIDGTLEATSRGLALTVVGGEPGIDVDVDRQIVAGALVNLMQNAFKFTRPDGNVSLRTSATATHVRIEVEDECGGLPAGKAEELFGAFQQQGEDRSGLGLGLFISRKGIEANGGVIEVKDLPGHGCVFSIELPRATAD